MVVSTLKESGPVNVVYNIIKGCTENEIEFHIVSISKEPTNNLVNRFLKLSVNYKNLELNRFSSIFKGRNALKKYLITKNINIIHLHGFRPNYLGFLMAKSYKTISTIHNNPYEDYINRYGKILGKIMNFSQDNFFKGMNAVVSVSESNTILISTKINKEVITIENGIDTNKFRQSETSRKLIRNGLGLRDKDLLFISVGHLSYIKNPLFIIDAFKKTKFKNAKLIFLGDGKLYKNCISRIENDNRVMLLGRKENVTDYFSASDVLISSSITEGMPNAVIEAMSCNNILLLSKIPSHNDILSKGNIGYSFSINNLDSLKDAIIKVDRTRSEFKIKELRATAINNFDLTIMSKEYKKLYYEN